MDQTSAVLFFDIDGTLIYHSPGANVGDTVIWARPTDRTFDAFRRLHDRGHKTFICTGRPRTLVNESLMALNPTGLVTLAGACLIIDGKKVYERTIDENLLEDTVSWLVEHNIPVMFEGSENCAALVPEGPNPFTMFDAPVVRSMADLRAKTDLRFSKFSYHGDAIRRVGQMDGELRASYGLYNLGVGAGEAAPVGIDKGEGVRHTLEVLGHSIQGTFAFGDSENDMAMIQAAGLGVGVANVSDGTRPFCDMVLDTTADDGALPELLKRVIEPEHNAR